MSDDNQESPPRNQHLWRGELPIWALYLGMALFGGALTRWLAYDLAPKFDIDSRGMFFAAGIYAAVGMAWGFYLRHYTDVGQKLPGPVRKICRWLMKLPGPLGLVGFVAASALGSPVAVSQILKSENVPEDGPWIVASALIFGLVWAFLFTTVLKAV